MNICGMAGERVRLRIALVSGLVTGILLGVLWTLDPIGDLTTNVILPFLVIFFLLGLIPYRPIGETAAALLLVAVAIAVCTHLCVGALAQVRIHTFRTDMATISAGMNREDVRQTLDKYSISESESRFYYTAFPRLPRTFIQSKDAYVDFDSNGSVCHVSSVFSPDT